MDIVDTHLHIIDHRRLSYPWVGNYRQLSGNYLYETYSAQALSLGIARTLLMEVDVPVEQIEDEAQMAEDLRRELGPPMVGAVISCRPEDPEFPAFLDRQLRRPHIRGLRRVLHVAPDDISRAYLFRENLRRLAASGLPFDVCVLARQLGLAAEFGRRLPKYAIRARSLRSARDRVGHLGAVACGDRRSCAEAESRRQDFRPPRLCGLARLDRRRTAPLCRALHRRLRLESGRLGQRLADLPRRRTAQPLGRGDAVDHRGVQRARAKRADGGERGAHLPTLERAAICLTPRRHCQERAMTASVFDLDPRCSIGRESCRH